MKNEKQHVEKENMRIMALLQAMRNGREQARQIMEGGWKERPAFAVDEIYDFSEEVRSSGSGIGPEEESEQMDFFTMEDSRLILPVGTEMGRTNRIAAGDNLDYMAWLLHHQKMAGKLQLIYVDPPFFSNAKYQSSIQITSGSGKKSPVLKVGAYEDQWGHDLERYLEMLAVRFFLMRELLSDTGSLWVHLDWHGSHYVKMMLDEIFGPEQFINEVAWTYKSGGASKRSFSRKHDTLLFYAKTKSYKFHPLKEKSYNREYKPYRFKGVEEFEDELGWYTMVNMKDVWSIDMVGRTSSERMGYATQKPEKLLERIVEACSDPGDLCADFFAGTGTLAAVCCRKGRQWIMCDDGNAAIESQIRRVTELAGVHPGNGAAGSRSEGKGSPGEGAQTLLPFLVERPVLPHETRSRATAQVSADEDGVRLERYKPDLTQVREQDREIVASFIQEDSLDLISFWSLDSAYRGQEHRCRRLLSGKETALPEAGSGGISIVGYDIFGGRFTWTQWEDEEQ